MAPSATTVVVGLGLVAGAVYLATRKAAAAGDSPDSLCSAAAAAGRASGVPGGGAACTLLGPVLAAVKHWVKGECSDAPQFAGWWSKETGFTGDCYLDKDDKAVRADAAHRPKMFSPGSAFDNVVWDAGYRTTGHCCKPGDTKKECTRKAAWSTLPGYCTRAWTGAGEPTVRIHTHGAVS